MANPPSEGYGCSTVHIHTHSNANFTKGHPQTRGTPFLKVPEKILSLKGEVFKISEGMNESAKALYKLATEDFGAYSLLIHNEGLDFTKDELRWKPSALHLYLCKTVQEFVETETGDPYNILLLSVPPQFGKSKTITESYPSFYLGKNPEGKVIEISYSESFAQRFGRRNKEKVRGLGGALFGISLSANTKSNKEFELSNGIGGMISRGIFSGVTGNPANLMIIDDPIKNREQASSKDYRDKLWEEWINTFRTRVSDGGKVILIQTRWHEDDLYGRLSKDKYAKSINIPCISEGNDPLGREEGEGLCQEIGKGTEWARAYKRGLVDGTIEEGGESGERAWLSLFQGRPSNEKGNLIKRSWWKYYEGEVDVSEKIMSVDASFKGESTSDYVVISIWGKRGSNIYMLDHVREHLGFLQTVEKIKQRKALFGVNTVLIEDKANGTAIIDTLRKTMPGIIGITPKGSKVERLHAVSFVIESGHVYLQKDKPYTAGFVEECSSFPNGKYDDQVDALTQALSRLMWIKADSIERTYPRRKHKRNFAKGEKITVV